MRISTGSNIMDKLLQGGYETDIITTVYGPAGSGKTLMCLLAAIASFRRNKKIIYVDAEGGFSVERLRQLTPDWKKVLDNIIFLKPTSFQEQKDSFKRLRELASDNIGLIIVDTIGMLYRLELGKDESNVEVNRELGRQLNYLVEVARKKTIPILVSNQVYANFDEKHGVNVVGGDIIKYTSKCLMELQIVPDNLRRVVLRKHRSIPGEQEMVFRIVEKGIAKAKSKFRLF